MMPKENRKYWQIMEDQQAIGTLIGTIHARASSGMVSADITRLYGSNQTRRLKKAESMGLLVSAPTNRRHLGRRWYTPDFAPTDLR